MPPQTPQNALQPGTVLMEYRMEAVLGAGGFGITYLATDTHLDKRVAIKEYLPSAFAVRGGDGTVLPTAAKDQPDFQWGLDRFLLEARTLARFSHPNIVRVNRFFEAHGTGYMVMDYEDGESLKAWLARNPRPPEADLKALVGPLLDGLEQVHGAGFLHRDIKPDNVFVRRDGSPVLIDFGAARQALGNASQSLTAIVSPGYAPFEQYSTSSEQGPWSDLYALCGVLYLAVTGQPPADAIARMKADPIPQALAAARARYSPAFIDAIAWGLAPQEGLRPASVAQLREALAGRRSAPAPLGVQAAAGAPPNAAGTSMAGIATSTRPMTGAAERAPSAGASRGSAGAATIRIPSTGGSPAGGNTTIIIAPSREPRAASSPVLRWAVPALVMVAVVAFGVRTFRPSDASKPPPAVTAAATTDAMASATAESGNAIDAASGGQSGATVVAADAATNAAAVTSGPAATPSDALGEQPASPASTVTPVSGTVSAAIPGSGSGSATAPGPVNPVPTATPLPASPQSPTASLPQGLPTGANPALESLMRGGGAGIPAGGYTREEMARGNPQLAARFGDMDMDGDGRVTAQELLGSVQRMQAQRDAALQQ